MSADLAVYAEDPSGLDSLDRQSVVALMERGKTWLTMAVERDAEIGDYVEFKGQAETVRVYTVQKQLGKDAELAAAELVRRAERHIGLAIRKGQEAGEIRRTAITARRPGEHVAVATMVSPTEAAQVTHRADLVEFYAQADNVSDEQYDAAIYEAKAEGNLSRANVVRKVTGRAPKPSRRPEVLRGTRRTNTRRVVAATVDAYATAHIGPDLMAEIDLGELETQDLQEWISSLSESARAVRSLQKTLEKELNRRV